MTHIINSKKDGARFLAIEQCSIWCAKPDEFASGALLSDELWLVEDEVSTTCVSGWVKEDGCQEKLAAD